jgi:hypothetical protein
VKEVLSAEVCVLSAEKRKSRSTQHAALRTQQGVGSTQHATFSTWFG